MTDDINYTKEAFLNTWNLVFLLAAAVTIVGLGVAGGVPGWMLNLAVVLGLGIELLYLGTVPRSQRFQRHVRSQKMAERTRAPSQREIFSQLRNRSQRRYAKLRKLKDQIRENYQRLSTASQGLLDNHLKKIDGLLASYLDLLHQRERYRDFTDSATENSILKSIEALKKDMSDDSERVRAVKQRRLKVLEQRLARFHKAHENLEIIGAQLGTIEDVVKYIHEQSWTLQDPQEVSMQLDALLEEVEATQSSIREIEDVFSSPSDYIDEDLEELDAELEEAVDSNLDGALDLPSEDEAVSEEEGGTSERSRVQE
ncbi:MAG: hypothetical protein R6T83_10060 [Salinibacter sp.]